MSDYEEIQNIFKEVEEYYDDTSYKHQISEDQNVTYLEIKDNVMNYPNLNLFVDSFVNITLTSFSIANVTDAQSLFNEAMDNLYNCIIFFPSLKAAICFPIGLFPRNKFPAYENNLLCKARLFIANNHETPDFFRNQACLLYKRRFIEKIFKYYNV